MRASQDGRRVELRLTAKGKEVAANAILTTQEKLMLALRDLPPPVVSQLAQGLDALILSAGLSSESSVMFFEPYTIQQVNPK